MLVPDTNIAFVRATSAALLLGLTALIIIVMFNIWLVRDAAVYSERVTAARLQRTAIVDLQNLVLDAETGQRGYLLTGNSAYLKPYLEARQNSEAQLAGFTSVMNRDPQQKADTSNLIPLITNKLAELQQTIDLANANKRDANSRVRCFIGTPQHSGKKLSGLHHQRIAAIEELPEAIDFIDRQRGKWMVSSMRF
jgi:CHASE3 domain sensor protein